jgi:hypothetical protein
MIDAQLVGRLSLKGVATAGSQSIPNEGRSKQHSEIEGRTLSDSESRGAFSADGMTLSMRFG